MPLRVRLGTRITRICPVLLASAVLACDPASTDDDGPLAVAGFSDDHDDAVESALVTAALPGGPSRAVALPAAGWLELEDSPIVPWCGATLVAPDVVVTAAWCVDGWHPSHLGVGFDALSDRRFAIDEVVIEADPEIAGEEALAALRLREPVRGLVPADLHDEHDGCGLTSVAPLYVVRGDARGRWLWSGCLEGDELEATKAPPNCHGDGGAGAFAEGGALVGVAIGPGSQRDEIGCANGHRIAAVAARPEFFDEALALSQPPTP